MTQDEIIQGNKIIAEFMGCEVIVKKLLHGTEIVRTNREDWEIVQYHTSWDWLMPVYLKIVNEELYSDNDEGIIIFNILYERLADGDGINEVYIWVTNFINWYNSTVKK